jgi:hypothetical protein
LSAVHTPFSANDSVVMASGHEGSKVGKGYSQPVTLFKIEIILKVADPMLR